jgi:hypothetical protein
MKAVATFLAVLVAGVLGVAQTLHFENTASTLISAEGIPIAPAERFRFALFLGPSTIVDAPGITLPFDDPSFQQVDAYNTNTPLAIGAGRLQRCLVVIPEVRLEELGFWSGTLGLDFVVRGWSENAGTTWEQALSNWNHGSPLMPMYIGTSTVGNNFIPSFGAQPEVVIFGIGSNQILGFNMILVPEPSVLALTALGGIAFQALRRKRERRPVST